MNRIRLRQQDVQESYYLLLELCCGEPILRQGFSIIENICLAHGVSASEGGRPLTPEFQRHVDRYWVSFLVAAIQASHVYGFVPWRVRRISGGDFIPEVLPPGSFRWTIEVPKESDAMLAYKVKLNPGQRDIPEADIFLTEWVQPNYMVNELSPMYATVASPMAYVIESYKHLQAAIKRQAHADAWNCTARITVSHEPKEFNHDQHRREVLSTFSDALPERGAFHSGNNLRFTENESQRDQVDDAFIGRSMNHQPAVYALPSWRHLESSPMLQPCMDIPFLQNKYKFDVCSLLGIPPDLITTTGGGGKAESQNSQSKNRSQGLSRIFQAKMQRVCAFLRELCKEVYKKIYKKDADFDIVPMPRLEIRDVEDLKILHEIGVIQPEHTLELGSILMGKFKKMKPAQIQAQRKESSEDPREAEKAGGGAKRKPPPAGGIGQKNQL
jgi:hypothetical protein